MLVTGGCGFIGSHIVDKLIDARYEVAVVDNLSTGKIENIDVNKVSFYECDIVNEAFINVVRDFEPEYIIHQAAQASVPVSISNLLLDTDINIKGSINLIEAARRNKVKKIIFASTAAVYGEPHYLPIDEKHPINPQSPYGLSKYTVEQYLKLANSLYGIDYTILRYSNVYGPRQDATGEGGVVAIFAEKFARRETQTIFGDGEQTRDFIYVEEVADANIKALKNISEKVINISTGKSLSINDLYKKMAEITKSPQKPVYKSERAGDIRNSVLLNEKKQGQLLNSISYTIEQGLQKTLEDYLKYNELKF